MRRGLLKVMVMMVAIFLTTMPFGCKLGDCSKWEPGTSGCPPAPPRTYKYSPFIGEEIAMSWVGRQIDELIEHWGRPWEIRNCDQECIKKTILRTNPEYTGKDARWYTWKETGQWVMKTRMGNLPFTHHEEMVQDTCLISFAVDDKGKIIRSGGWGISTDCTLLIRQTNWREAPERPPTKKPKPAAPK